MMEVPPVFPITYYIVKEGRKMPDDKLVLAGVRIIFRNFSGNPTQYNPEGKRNFCVLLDPDVAEKLKAEGWNVRWLEGRLEGEEPQAYMQVAVSFKNYPPNIMMVTKKKQTHLNEDSVGSLDWAEIKNVDLTIRPFNWEVNGKSGTKGYLKSMYVTVEEDEFAEKYSEFPTDSTGQLQLPTVVHAGETLKLPGETISDN